MKPKQQCCAVKFHLRNKFLGGLPPLCLQEHDVRALKDRSGARLSNERLESSFTLGQQICKAPVSSIEKGCGLRLIACAPIV
nr:hypothetical protein CFP56_16257 [Quercus suber]